MQVTTYSTEGNKAMHKIQAYVFDAAIYCPDCADRIYGTYTLTGVFDGSLLDREGNAVTAHYSWELEASEACMECGETL